VAAEPWFVTVNEIGIEVPGLAVAGDVAAETIKSTSGTLVPAAVRVIGTPVETRNGTALPGQGEGLN